MIVHFALARWWHRIPRGTPVAKGGAFGLPLLYVGPSDSLGPQARAELKALVKEYTRSTIEDAWAAAFAIENACRRGRPAHSGVAAAVANGQSENCKGKFASGRVSELVDCEVVFRGFSSCEDTNGHITSQFFVVPRRVGGFVVFSVFGDEFTVIQDRSQSDDSSQPEELAGYQ